MSLQKLKEFLDKENVKYVSIKHSSAYTAQEIAASAHIPGKELAKTVMVKINGKMAMAVLPASYKIDIKLLKEITGADNIRLADETEFKDKFPDCEVGAMPPFGNLYNIDVYAAQSLEDDEDIDREEKTRKRASKADQPPLTDFLSEEKKIYLLS